MGPFENSTVPSITRDNPTGGDPIMVATLSRIHRPDDLHELCSLANSAIGEFEKENMTPNQFRAAIEAIGLSQRGAGLFLGVDERTSRRWALGEAAIPESVAKLLRLMVRLKLSPEDVK